MVKQKRSLVTLAVIFLIFTVGVSSILMSFPLYNVYTALERGGVPEKNVKIFQVFKNSPAQAAGLLEGDYLVAVNGTPVSDSKSFTDITQKNVGKSVSISVKRGKKEITVSSVPRVFPPEGEGALGIAIGRSVTTEEPITLIPRAVVMSYLGYEEKFPDYQLPSLGAMRVLHLSEPTFDNGYGRLVKLISGFIVIIASYGLLKSKKWGFYAYFAYGAYSLGAAVYFSFGYLFPFSSSTLIILSALIFDLLILLYLYSRRNQFRS